MDTFGPITDNAGGIAEFSRAEAGAREITDRLDAVGNTTKALTKGYAIASASLAAFLLFSAYIDKVNLIHDAPRRARCSRRSTWPTSSVFVAALIGAMLVYFFSSLAIRAVGTTAQAIIVEVRRQFREMPGIMDYTPAPGLRARRRHHDQGRPARDDRAGRRGRRHADRRRAPARRRGRRRHADGRHDRRRPARDRPQQRRRRLGQRQEVHRVGQPQGRRRATSSARAPTPTPRPSSATRSAIRSRTPPARRSTSSSSCWPRSPSSSRRSSSGSDRHAVGA